MKKKIKYHILQITVCILVFLAIGCTKKNSTTNNPLNPVKDTTVTDVDGNIYDIISINGQRWTKQNLRTTRYRDGTPIPKVTDGTDWSHLTTGAYCEYNNDPANGAVYGKLYNWFAVNTGILAPSGWHVPSQAEWAALETFLGATNPGGKMKETGTLHWWSPNEGATNESGWTGLPGGSRFSTGSFNNLPYDGYWWSADEGSDPAYANYHWLDFNTTYKLTDEDYKQDGLSVRCVHD